MVEFVLKGGGILVFSVGLVLVAVHGFVGGEIYSEGRSSNRFTFPLGLMGFGLMGLAVVITSIVDV